MGQSPVQKLVIVRFRNAVFARKAEFTELLSEPTKYCNVS